MKTYSGCNDVLRATHDLDIQDKHTSPILIMKHFDPKLTGEYSSDAPANSSIRVVADVNYQFGPGTALVDRFVIEALEEGVELVEGILKAFASLVAARTTSRRPVVARLPFSAR